MSTLKNLRNIQTVIQQNFQSLVPAGPGNTWRVGWSGYLQLGSLPCPPVPAESQGRAQGHRSSLLHSWQTGIRCYDAVFLDT